MTTTLCVATFRIRNCWKGVGSCMYVDGSAEGSRRNVRKVLELHFSTRFSLYFMLQGAARLPHVQMEHCVIAMCSG